MSDIEGIKSFVYAWLQKSHHKTPEYTFQHRAVGRGRLRFICELRVDGFSYVGVGNSLNKKDAQTNAARDFANYLVREGYLRETDLPTIRAEEYTQPTTEEIKPTPTHTFQSSSSTTHSQAIDENSQHRNPNDSYINRILDQKKLEEAEEVDLTADIHGGWSMENAKARLNEYIQFSRQQPVQIKYTAIGPDHNRSFLAEATVLAKRINKSIYARENGSNKVMASRACSLSLVRQLFHVGEIEAYRGDRKKKRSDEVPSILVELDPHLENRLHALLEKLHLVPNLTPPKFSRITGTENTPDGHSMIMNYKIADFEPRARQSAQVVSWCPPIANWNPWTACNIDEGPEALMTLQQISRTYKEQHNVCINSPEYISILNERNALPAATFQRQILDTISKNQVTLIKGETGCGKTTQIPQFILDSYLQSGRGAECSILVTQPRRICAISLAERIASERCEPVGVSVGYSVRFETVLPRPYGSILFCTVGTLCRKMESGIRGVSHVIIDEIHERDVNTDFLMILMRDLVRENRSLRLILMSATIDTTTFTNYFGDSALVELEGRTHPVTFFYLEDCINMINYVPPPNPDDRKNKKPRTEEQLTIDAEENCNLICPPGYPSSVGAIMRQMPEKEIPFALISGLLDYICGMNIDGAVLVFLPGWNTISMLKKYLQTHPHYRNQHEFLILSLHSQVPREDQRLVFRPTAPGVRKIVLSTNIAESSITINDVVFVIDACLARVKMFTARNNMTSYSTVWASRTNLEQRRGRAGRVRAGFAFHLCSQARLSKLDQHSTPEILRTPLHELALMIKLLRLGDIQEFLKKAIQPPPIDAVIEAEYTLREMKALDSNDELTPLGHILARLPIEPRLGRMLVFSCAFHLGGAMALLAAHSSFGSDAFSMPPDRRRLSWDQIRFAGGTNSDHLAMLNVYQVWSAERQRNGDQSAHYLCEAKEFNGSSLRIIEDAASQIRNILIGLDFPESVLSDRPINFNNPNCTSYDYLTAMLTSGLYPNVAFHVEKRKLLTVEGKCALVHKASVNCIKNPSFTFPFFTFTEKIRTQAISCKTLTMITPIHLLIFGCRRGVWRPNNGSTNQSLSSDDFGIVLLDDWIPLRMRYATAARIFAIRPALEALLVRICLQPSCLDSLSPDDASVIELTKALCEQRALRGFHASGPTVPSMGGDRHQGYSGSRFHVDVNRPLLSGQRRRVGPEMDTATFHPYDVYANSKRSFGRGEGRSGDGVCGQSHDHRGISSHQRSGPPGMKRNYSSSEEAPSELGLCDNPSSSKTDDSYIPAPQNPDGYSRYDYHPSRPWEFGHVPQYHLGPPKSPPHTNYRFM